MNSKQNLSIIILTNNDEDIIADTIESLSGLYAELIVVDSQSTDRTAQIAKHLGAQVYIHPFIDFARQRNFAFSKATCSWVLYLDSDEEATEQFKKDIVRTIEMHDFCADIGGYFIKRNTFYFGKKWGLIDQVQRLFVKDKFIEWSGIVHETPRIHGSFGTVNSPINHYTHRNLSQMVAKTNEWTEYEVYLRYSSHHPQMNTWRFIRIITTGFFDSYFRGRGYKNGTAGIVESLYQSFSLFITYAKLWEKQIKK